VSLGEIALPLVRIEASSKCAKGVGLMDLAAYLDRQMEAARKEGPSSMSCRSSRVAGGYALNPTIRRKSHDPACCRGWIQL
jgi:hypothetical protein